MFQSHVADDEDGDGDDSAEEEAVKKRAVVGDGYPMGPTAIPSDNQLRWGHSSCNQLNTPN
jgi:hypothetical protein